MTDDLELLPYSQRRRRLDIESKLPQDRTPDEDINAVVDEHLRGGAQPAVNLGFLRFKTKRGPS